MSGLAVRVAVTGAAGFVGRQAVAALLRRGAAVTGLGRGARPARIDAAAEWRTADLLAPGFDGATVASELGCDHLLHLAWITEPGAYRQSPDNALWHEASCHLARSFVAAGGRRIVAVGTGAEYAAPAGGRCDPSTTAAPGHEPYSAAKAALRRDLAVLAERTGVSLAWARVFQPYGPHEDPRRFVADLTLRLLRGEPALCRHGGLLRDFIHVRDAGEALAAIVLSGVEGALDVCSGEAVALSEVAMRLGTLAGRPDLVRIESRPAPAEPPTLCGAPYRLREAGFVPGYDLASGLADTVTFWRGKAACRLP